MPEHFSSPSTATAGIIPIIALTAGRLKKEESPITPGPDNLKTFQFFSMKLQQMPFAGTAFP